MASRRAPTLKGLGGVRGVMSAAILLAGGAALGWLSVRSAMVRTLPPTAPAIARFAADDPDIVLADATGRLVTQHGLLDSATLDAVRRAAVAAPLDARPYLILGHQQLLDAMPGRAVATLEAGQRLDPRQRLIHLLLLDRYLRTRRYADAATQFSVLARLLGATRAPIAVAMAQMTLTPATRDAVGRTLRGDAELERAVLKALAASDTPPATVFALASPAALADARRADSWGPVLVARMVGLGRYATARAVWRRVYRVPPAQAAALVTNAGFHEPAAPSNDQSASNRPPFDWTLTADSLGAADIRENSLAVDYYGRDSGALARQLLVLPPGRYRFAVTVDPGKTDAAARLFWSLACARHPDDTASEAASDDPSALMTLAVTATARAHWIATEVVVPPGCPAQVLALRGETGDFPAPLAVTLRDLDLAALPDARP